MRKLAVSIAAMAMLAAPVSMAYADTPDIYSKDGVTGPSLSRSTQCAAAHIVAMQVAGTAQPEYKSSLKQGTAWLLWARQVAEGQDATAEMNRRKSEFISQGTTLDQGAFDQVIVPQIKACDIVRDMFDGIEPFSGIFSEAVATSGNSADANTPDLLGAADCMTNYSVIAEIIGKDHENYTFYNKGSDGWYDYAIALAGLEEADRVIVKRASEVGERYTTLLEQDQQAGLDRINSDSIRCVELADAIPEYF